jgi:hypothetical protein
MRIVRAVLLSVLALPLFAGGHDITPDAFGPAMQLRVQSGPVSNGKSFLTLWSDDTFGAGVHIYATLADENGVATRSFPFLAYASGVEFQAFAAGGEFVVFTYGAGFELVGAIPSTRIVVLDHRTTIYAWNGANFLAFGERGAEILDADGRVLVTGLSIAGPITAGASAADFVIGTQSNVIRIGADGKTQHELRFDPVPRGGNPIAVATNGSRTLAVWVPSVGDLQYALLDASDGVIHQGSIAGALERSISSASVVWTGSQFEIAVHNGDFHHGYTGTSVKVIAIDSAGNQLYAPQMIAASAGPIAANANSVVVSDRLDLLSFPPQRPDLTQRQLALTTLRRQIAPVVVSNGVDFAALWDDQPGASMRFARVPRTTTSPDGPGLDVMTIDGLFGPHVMAYGGGVYLAVWHYWQQIYAARIDAGGVLLDTSPILIQSAPDVREPAVAWSSGNFVVMWQHFQGGYQLFSAATVTTAGAVSAPRDVLLFSRYAVPSGLQTINNTSLTSSDTQLLLTGELQIGSNIFCCGPQTVALVGFRIDRDLRAIDSGPVMLTNPIVTTTTLLPRAASNGKDFLIAYRTASYDVATTTVHAEGTLRADAPVIRLIWGSSVTTDVAWNGTEYVLVLRYNNDGNVGSRRSFVAALFIDASGTTRQFRATAAGPSEYEWRPSVASAAGESVIAISEAAHPGENVRARAYFTSELPVARPAPNALAHVAAVVNGSSTEVAWESASGSEAGFIIYATARNGRFVSIVLPGEVRTVSLQLIADVVRVTPFNEGGRGPVATLVPGVRHRSASH